ncbi:unnamed protein product, partial [Prorocentrum cordatum]
CNVTVWHMQHHWINRSIVAEFPAGCGQKVFKAGDGHRFELRVVDGFSLQSDVDRFCSLHTTMMHVRKSFTDWLPTYMIAHNIQHENYNRIRELEEASIQWIKDGMQQKLNERIQYALNDEQERINAPRQLKATTSAPKEPPKKKE